VNIHSPVIVLLALTISLIFNGNIISSNIASAVLFNDNLVSSNIDHSKNIDLGSLFQDNYQLEEEVGEDTKMNSPFDGNYRSSGSSDDSSSVFDYLPSQQPQESTSQQNTVDDKYVVVMFDRGYDNIFTTAKPILDKYGFKASIFIACDYIESAKGMNWDQVRQLYLDGYDIESHGSEHTRLTDVQSYDQIESIVSGGKECLQEHGFTPTAFQAPYNKGGDDPVIVDTISKYFDLAFTGHSELMFLNCDGWENFGYDKKNYYGTTDCRPYFSDGTPTPTNKFGIKEWSHDRIHYKINHVLKGDPYGPEVSQALFDKFMQVVNDQTYFNKNGQINAIPIIGYHEIKTDGEISTSPELFDQEMEYLSENGFKVITIEDLEYDQYQERFHIKKMGA